MNFKKRYEELGGKFEEIELQNCIRLNTLKDDAKNILNRLRQRRIKLTKVPFLKHGYYASAEFSLGSTADYLLGFYYLQEAAAQIPVQILDPKSNELVVDMCASPGGKTTQIAQMTKNEGQLIALDVSMRVEKLRNNLERLGISNCSVYKRDARFFDLPSESKAHKILLDAPCSGNYVIEQDWFSKRTMEDIKACAKVQRELLGAGIKNLKKDGILVYSTCSLEPEENELVIDWALKKYGDDIDLVDTKLSIGDEGIVDFSGFKLDKRIKLCKRFWPHKIKTQGFFISKIVKN
jgi:NOL1/NOP2/sun family putative RNA methylase